MRTFKILAEIPDGRGDVFYEEVDTLQQEIYPDISDIRYLKNLTKELFPDALCICVYELMEEVSINEERK